MWEGNWFQSSHLAADAVLLASWNEHERSQTRQLGIWHEVTAHCFIKKLRNDWKSGPVSQKPALIWCLTFRLSVTVDFCFKTPPPRRPHTRTRGSAGVYLPIFKHACVFGWVQAESQPEGVQLQSADPSVYRGGSQRRCRRRALSLAQRGSGR